MLNDAHHAWLQEFTGVDTRASAGGNATIGSPVPDAGSDKQSQALKQQMAPILTAIDGDLGFTAGHAEDAAHQALLAQREALVHSYGEALHAIDPQDENKAKDQIKQLEARAGSVRAAIGKSRQEVEKHFNDWQSRVPKAEEAGKQLDEMTDWGHPKAAPMEGPFDAIGTEVDARRFANACQALDKMLPEIAPVYQDYTAQKAAQATYEPARTALEPRLQATQTSTFKKLEPVGSALPPEAQAVDAAASGKDFVKALQLEQVLEGKVGDYEKALADLQQKKKAYEDAWAGVQDKYGTSGQRPPTYVAMEPIQDQLEAAHKTMQDAVDGEDFDAALTAVHDVDAKATMVEQLRQEMDAKKQAFEAADQKLEPRITQASQSQYSSLASEQKEIADQKQQLDDVAGKQDYDAAMKLVDTLSSLLDQFEKAVQELEAKKQAYEEKVKPIEEVFGSIGQSEHPKLKDQEADIAARHLQMADLAGKEDYTAAGAAADDLQRSCDDYKKQVAELERLKGEFDQAWPADLKPRVDKMTETRTDDLAALQQQVLGLVEQLEKTPETEEYEQGLSNATALKKALDDYESHEQNDIVTITFNGKPISGTQAQLLAAKIQLTNALVNQLLPTLKSTADMHKGALESQRQVNNDSNVIVFVMGAIVRKVGGADLDQVAPLIDAQFAAIAKVEQAINSNPAGAGDAYRDAAVAINTAGQALSNYLDKLEGGAKTTEFVAEATAVLAFALLGALAAPAMGAATGMGAVGASVAGGAAASAFEAVVREAVGPLSVGNKVKPLEVTGKVVMAAALGALSGLVGEAGFHKAVQETVMKKAVEGLEKDAAEKLLESKFKEELIRAVDSAIVAAANTVANSIPGFFDEKNPLTIEKFAVLVAVNMVEGALGPKIAGGRKLYPGANAPVVE